MKSSSFELLKENFKLHGSCCCLNKDENFWLLWKHFSSKRVVLKNVCHEVISSKPTFAHKGLKKSERGEKKTRLSFEVENFPRRHRKFSSNSPSRLDSVAIRHSGECFHGILDFAKSYWILDMLLTG